MKKERKYPNIQYTNASQLNDPFDCHPKLLDYSNVPDDVRRGIPKEWCQEKEENDAFNLRRAIWLCSLSNINDSILMWSHYCYNHKGVCMGLDIDKVLACVPPIFGTIHTKPFVWDVQYKDIIDKPDFTKSPWEYQLITKAKAWEYEQEVRLVMKEPNCCYMGYTEEQKKHPKEIWDKTDPHMYQPLKGECFESIYLGINIDPKEKEKICSYARAKINSGIKIYQMTIDENAFRLKAEQIDK